VAGRHRKPSTFRREHHRGRHRKPPSTSLTVVPAVVAVAILAVGAVAFGHAVADGQAPKGAASLPGIATAPSAPTAIVTPALPTAPAVPTSSASPSHSAQPEPGVPTPLSSKRPRHHAAPAVFTILDRHGDCYLQVRNSHDRLLAQRILRSGQRQSFRQHDLRVVLGNAGAAWISVDGHHAHRAGRAGQVRQFHIR
jgi:hypothetical protein